MNVTLIIGAAIILLVILILASYVKAPPSIAYVISGVTKFPRVLVGKGGLKIPLFQRLDKVYLGQISVDVWTEKPVPTKDFIDVEVNAVAKVRVIDTPEGIRLAAKNFLNNDSNKMIQSIEDTLQGNMREIISSTELVPLNNDRKSFADKITETASSDMAKLGLEVLSFNIQDITNEQGLIQNLGAANTAKIQKDASINKAIANKEVAIAQAAADKESNDKRVESQTAIAERNTELELKKADLQIKAQTAKANADLAYKIQTQEQLKTLNIKTVEADIEKTKQEQELKKQEAIREQNTLEATVNKQADAAKYKVTVTAEAALAQKMKEADANLYTAKQNAEEQKAIASAKLFSAQQEAEGIKCKGLAEAQAIQAKAEAEAAGLQKKAEAYEKYGDAATIQMVLEKLPEIATNVANPIKSISKVNIYGGNADGVSSMSGIVPTVIAQTLDVVKSATGVDLAKKLASKQNISQNRD